MLANDYQPSLGDDQVNQAVTLAKLNQVVADFSQRGILREGYVYLHPVKCVEILLRKLNEST